MNEIFKDIQGYEGLYQVSNLGNVLSLPKGDGNGNRSRLLRVDINKRSNTNYHRVTLCKDSKAKRFQVHRLVAQAFIPNPHNKPFVNHIDNNGENNSVTNLEWVTHTENMEHSANQGRQDSVRLKGGLACGSLRHEQSLLKSSQLIGQRFGTLIVQSIFFDESLKRPKLKATCLCDCGTVTNKYIYKLKPNITCIECSYKSR